MEYIDKDTLVAEIDNMLKTKEQTSHLDNDSFNSGRWKSLKKVKDILDTLEVKEVDEKFECPTIKVIEDKSVSSRIKYIDEDLKPIAEFIMDYASWNLHKDEWNQPVLEVPLFRVLDALIQRGKPYCCGG